MIEELENYIKSHGGNKYIDKILIANNGIAAVKAIRSVRKWAYSNFGNERIIKFVVMATPEDMKANAEYIRMADQILEVPGGTNNNNYANVDVIVDLAERAGVQAVWAGWGHASENPRLPDMLSKTSNKISFIGPPAGPMQDLGDKIASTIVAQSADVTCVPWSGSGLTVDYSKTGVPEDVLRAATIATVEEAIQVAHKVGFPAMIKASEGGGGKGIRKVLSMDDLAAGFRQVQSEVPGSPIFFMKLVSNARHLEVQIIADQHGEAISLNGRDCSVQRRHQKIIEEGPPLAPTPETWESMERAAVRLVKEVGYVGAGTVEYLFANDGYYFLELNPRLQVEHPVTEEITGVNLPATQLQISMGIPLFRIPDIRKLYNEKPNESSLIDLQDYKKRASPKNHCIAVRITGENPDEGFKPTSGQIHELIFRSTPNIWGYFSVGPKGGLHEYADSQFGHIFASGATREEARRTIILGLKEISIRGEIRTPVEYIIHLLETDAFKKGEIHTGWLDQLIIQKVKTIKPDTMVVVTCGALYKASSTFSLRQQEFSHQVHYGQLPSLELLQNTVPVELIYENIKYQFEVSRTGSNSYSISLLKDKSIFIDANIQLLSDGGLLILLNGATHVCYGREDVTGLCLIIDSKTCVFSEEYDPSILRTTSPGKLVRFLVDDGSLVSKGAPYAEIEVMKMYMPLTAPEKGRIRFVLSEGSVMSTGAVIANLELEDSTSIQKSVDFSGSLKKMSPPSLIGEKPHQLLKHTINNVKNVLCGYESFNLQSIVDSLFIQINDPLLPIYEFKEALSVIQSRIPSTLFQLINHFIKLQQPLFTDSKQLAKDISLYLNKLLLENESLSNSISATIKPILDLTDKYHDGVEAAGIDLIKHFLEEFILIESDIQHRNIQTVLKQVRQTYKDNTQKVVDIALSLHNQSKKYKFIMILLQKISDSNLVIQFMEPLKKLSTMGGSSMDISLKAKQIIVRSQLPSSLEKIKNLEANLQSIVDTQSKDEDERLKKILNISRQSNEISDVLIPFFSQNYSDEVRRLAMEIYVRHSYRSYHVEDSKVTLQTAVDDKSPDFSFIEWFFYITLPNSNSGNVSPTLSPLIRSSNGTLPSPRPMSIFNGLSMIRTDSTDNITAMEDQTKLRYGMMVNFDSIEKFGENLSKVLKVYNNGEFSKTRNNSANNIGGESTDILSVILNYYPESISQENHTIQSIVTILRSYVKDLGNAHIRRITFICSGSAAGSPLKYFTFRERHLYLEDPIFRHIEPAMAYHLEVRKLSNYDITHIPTESQRIHLYYAQEKGKKEMDPDADRCFFVRSVIRYSDLYGQSNDIKVDILLSQVETLLSESIEALEIAMSNKKYSRAQNHSIFLNIMPDVNFDEQMIGYVVQEIGDRLGKKLWKLRVGRVEVRGKIRKENSLIPVRLFIQNPTGYAFQVQCYYEQLNSAGQQVFSAVPGSQRGIWEGLPIDTPYPIMDAVQRNRFKAQRLDTTYVYDFPDLFRESLQNIWMEYMEANKNNTVKVYPSPRGVLEFVELILAPGTRTDLPPTVPYEQLPEDQRPRLEETYRPVGYNDIGMVAWRMTFYTPEYPQGRDAIVISNDITHQIGSFGPQEDLLFKLASELARKEGIPRIYLSSNSGARIGLADEVKNKFKVIWNNESDPSKGIKALYLDHADYVKLSETNSIDAKQDPTNPDRWIISDIIGQKNGIGVENLSWSGLIAGETSQAYDEIFTITLVTGRSVGIGAYLVRLGQRTIQNDAPIILTGASALNKVLGKEVYESNQQLGGAQIMYPNGVSHISVNDELHGITSILNWMSFIPKSRGQLVPILPPMDPVDRDIDFDPVVSGTKCDTRHLIQGVTSEHDPSVWISGMFDKDSFKETLAGWATTVITGRARLGGIPIGVIAVETKSVEKVIPADPANPLSQEQVSTQAAQVWYPDSSFKTAQAIADFNKGEQLPLMILANWRGFSGGMRDMFDEILKFGSMIVDNLRNYKQPVFVYIPPGGELRGGAWVVLDSTINLEMMEMYAAQDSRGGVLEPNGIVEIKYRDPDLIKTMHRLDSKLIEWDKEIPLGVSLNSLDEKQRSIKLQIQNREKELLGIYQQIAIKFADLHDTPGRMKAKGVINQVIAWKNARKYFYQRLRRRIYEENQINLMAKVYPTMNRLSRLEMLDSWIKDITGDQYKSSSDEDNNDEFIANAIYNNLGLLSDRITNLSSQYIQSQIIQFSQSDNEATLDGIISILPTLSLEKKNLLLSLLNNK